MKNLLYLTVLLSATCYAQKTQLYTVTKVDDGLHHLYYDSSSAKSTIVEFQSFLALLEVPVVNEGGGATNLKDHPHAGNRILETLKEHFPAKPLKYVIHSHWHPHSLSAISPFLENNITIISTKSNFEKLKHCVDERLLKKSSKLIQYIESDSFKIKEKGNEIVIHRFLKRDYPSTPTEEYLYFYLPKYDALHSGCMYNRWAGDPIDGRELLTTREVDLNKFLLARNIQPNCFIRSSGDKNEDRGVIAYQKFADVIAHGISGKEIREKYFNFTDEELTTQRDSVLKKIAAARVPLFMLNDEVYASLRANKMHRALQYAYLQTLLNPSDPNAWDSLGEVHYFLNNLDLANHFGSQARKIRPEFSGGGEMVWKKDLEEYRKGWK